MSFLNYRLADVRISPQVTLAEPDIVWDQEGDKAVVVRRPAHDLPRSVAGRPHPEGRRGHARAAHGGGRPAPLPRLGGPLPRPDRAVPGRRVQPRQVRWARSRPCRRGALLVVDRDHRHRRGRPGRPGLRRSRSSSAARRAPSAPTRPRPIAGVEKFFGAMPTWELYLEPSNVDVVVVPAIDGNFEPALSPMIPFERQFQTLPLAAELLPPQRAARARRARCPWSTPRPCGTARAGFVERFSTRPFYFVRAATPQVLLDEVDRVL